jgi:hypothetical protein
MIKFNKPANLNGAELLKELNENSIEIINPPFIDGNKDFWLDIKEEDEVKAAVVVAAHNGTTVAPEPTIADKLATVGLTLDDLKAALGL